MPTPTLGRLLIVDDEVELMTALREMLTAQGYEAVGFASGPEALEALREREFDLLLTDLMMPGLDGIALLRAAQEMDPYLVGVIMTGQGTVQTAVEAMKTGAFDYVLKPFKLGAVLPIMARALNVHRLRMENVQLHETVAIYELSQAIAFTLDLNTILNKAADAALQQCEADEVSIMLPTREGDELYVAVVRGEQHQQLLGARVPLEQGIAGWVARHREPLTLHGEVRDPRFAPLHPRPDIHSAISLPMLAGNYLVGVLNVNTIRRQRRLTLGQVKALSILVSTAAAALENAHLLAEVQANEKRFRALITNAPDAITLLDADGTVRYDSPAAQGLLGYDPEELLGTNAFERIHPEDRAATQAALQQLVETPGVKRSHTFRFRHKNGDWLWMEAVGSNLLAEPSVQGIVVNYRDITKRRTAQDALRESEDRYRDLVEHIHDLICTHDLEGQILSANQSASRMLGYAPHELVGKNLREILAPEVRHEFDDYLSTIQQKGAAHGLMRVETRSGESRIWEYDNSLRTEDVSAPIVRGFARDITERRRAEEALRESEAKLKALIDNTGDTIWSIDTEYRLTSTNATFRDGLARFVGREISNGESVFTGVSQAIVDEWKPLYARALDSETFTHVSISPAGLRGSLHRETFFNPIRGQDDKVIGVACFGRDITERKQAEAAIARQLEELKVLHAIATLGVEASAEDTLIEKATLVIGEVLYPDNFGVLLLDEAAGSLRLHPSYRGVPDAVKRTLIPLGRGVTGRVAASGHPRRIGDATREPDFLDFQIGVRSELCAPLKVGERVIGVVNTESAVPDAFSEADERLLVTMAGQLATAIDRLRAEAAQRQRTDELEALARVSNALRNARARIDMLPIILDQVMALLEADSAALAFRDPASGETVVELARGAGAAGIGTRLPPGEGISGQVIATGQPYSTNDLRSDPRTARPDLVGERTAAICIPLATHEETIGALWVGRKREIAYEELRLVIAIGDMAGSAIHRTALHEETEHRLQLVEALRNIDMAITASLDVRVTLNVFLDQAMAQLRVDAVAVLHLNPHTQFLEYAAGRGFRSRAIERSRLRLGEGYAGRAALERRAIHLPDVRKAEDYVRVSLLRGEDFVGYYVTPLVVKGHVKGVFEMYHRAPLHLSPLWLSFLEALAAQASIAIDNAGLYDDLQRSNAELALAYDTTLEGWARALELRDRETEGHTRRVTEMAERLARALGMNDGDLVGVRRGALLHDMGKMGVPDSILLKPGPLTDDEWKVMRLHPQLAYDMLSPINYLRPALDIPYCHHEKWDGSGYPRRLKGETIPLAARIFAVVDVWDALRSDRPYRARWPEEKVREYIREQAGKHFDPKVVEAFLEMTGGDV